MLKRISLSTGSLYRVSTLVQPNVKLYPYLALLYSHMTYAIMVWGKILVGNRNPCVNALIEACMENIFYSFSDHTIANNILLDYHSIFDYLTGKKLHEILHHNDHD